MNDIVTYTGIFLRLLTLIIMTFVVVPHQLQAFQLKDKLQSLKVMLLGVSVMVIFSTSAYLSLWVCRAANLSCMTSYWGDILIIMTSLSTLLISLTFAAIYNHKYLRKDEQ